MINLLSVAILAGFFFAASNQERIPVTLLPVTEALATTDQQRTPVAELPVARRCWTEWFDRDNPSGSGDWETLYHLRKANPGKICPSPSAIEAQTLTGLSVAAAGEVIYKSDTTTGFVCRNKDQKDKRCKDYRVRFICTPPFCGGQVCWTDWFDRDNPSGSGDWEILSSLRRANPGKICPTPLAIEAQTLTGLSVAAAGEVIYKSDTTTGFICLNRHQKDKRCKDYRVRFSCTPPFCGGQVCWTDWFDRDNPSGSGDWETLSSLRKANPGKICPTPLAIEAQTLTGLSVAAAGEVIYKSDTTTGFICLNRHQKDKRCKDYRVRFSCTPPFCGGQVCWTDWFDRDNPSGSGDWETLSSLRRANPGKICPTPGAIEAQTLTGLSVAAAGEVIYKSDTTTGFVCRNKDQKDKRCKDYRVRFSCSPPFCCGQVCWTDWFDRDNPSGSGDWETLYHLRKANPGKICPTPVAIEAQTLTGLSVAAAGEVIYKSDTTTGFVCRNRDQKDKRCKDYRVRFSCGPPFCGGQVCWTDWFDRDNPSGSGDWETLYHLRKANPGKICPTPLAIEAQTLTGLSVAAAGEVIYKSDTTTGFVCRNRDQKDKRCKDYRVRFSCGPPFCGEQVCWTDWFDRDNPSGSGDWETLSTLRRANPGKICPTPGAIEAQTLTGLSVAAAGEVIYKSDTTTGFVCRNRDQKDKRCKDYRVRFSCGPPFCCGQVCWTDWFDRDNPSGSGDWETLYYLRKANPGKICPIPLAIEAQTLTGLSVAAAGEVIYKSDTTTGFVCRNRDQKDKRCHDYRVRFSCGPPFCGGQVCWTDWFDRDNPSGSGDWETLYHLRKANPGKICPAPLAIEAQTLTGLSVAAAGEVIYKSDTTTGFVCRNKDQKDKRCKDYRVRFSCGPSFCGGRGTV